MTEAVESKGENMKKFFEEFKKFITRGNVVDMAVGVIVGGAFTAIVNSLNKDILTPLLGIFGGTDFTNLFVVLGEGEEAPAPAAPTTKKCPYCKSEIAIDATRCPHCTSQLAE